MNRFKLILATMAAGGLLTACTQSQTGPPNISSVNPLTTSKLQMAVGTANFDGVGPGLNVVTTMRQSNGDSAVLVDTPSLTGPFTFDIGAAPGGGAYSTLPTGPSLTETNAGNTISGTTQFILAGTPECDTTLVVSGFATCPAGVSPNTTTFGQEGGVFGMGLAPANNTINGTAFSYAPFGAPLFDTLGLAFSPWGGPPTFDPNKDGMGYRDGLFNIAQIIGIGMGITPFENVSPGTGSYTMSVVIPTSPTTHGTLTASGAINSLAMLPVPASPGDVEDGLGGATFTVTLPAGVTEAYLEIIDDGAAGGNCQGEVGANYAPVFYTIEVTASGSVTLPDMDGPNTDLSGGKGHLVPSPSLCTAAQNAAATSNPSAPPDTYFWQLIGFDYPLFEASYPASHSQAPTLAGASGQSDITFSAISTNVSGGVRPRNGMFTHDKRLRHVHVLTFRHHKLV